MHALVLNEIPASTDNVTRSSRRYGFLVVCLLLLLVTAGALVLRDLYARPISSVRIAGEFVNVSREALQRVVNEFLPSGFFELDVEAVRQSASEIPWIRRISVRRVWPDSMHVAVVERIAVARWNKVSLLEADGTRFLPDKTSLKEVYVDLSGPSGTEQQVLAQYARLAPLISTLNASVERLRLDKRGTWEVGLDNGLELQLGYEDNLESTGEYIALLPQILGERYDAAERIDFRYSSGFAVRWRNDTLPREGQLQ
jgi:cell division protein FtsQ